MPVGSFKFGLMAAAGSGGGPIIAYGGHMSDYETGGTKYRVHTFRGTGTLTVASGGGDATYLIVAGGGGGGCEIGGGGGAGAAGGADRPQAARCRRSFLCGVARLA